MKFTIEVEDDGLDLLATLIAGKLGTATPKEEDDDFGGTTEAEAKKELTLADMQDAVGKAVGVHGKDKVKAAVKKASGADKVGAIPAEKYQTVLDAIAKIK